MILLGWFGIIALVASVVLSIVARRTLWGARLEPAPPVPARDVPQGSILFAARLTRGYTNELIPLLADWQARGIIAVEQRGTDLVGNSVTGSAWGPEWQFSVRDATGLDEVEQRVLQILIPGAPRSGAVSLLRRDDTEARDAILDGVSAAVSRQQVLFGPRQLANRWLAMLLITLAIAGTLGALVFFAIGDAGPYPIAWAFLGGGAGIALVIAVCRSGRSPSEAERAYRQAVRNLEGWVHSTPSIDPRLAGWAMLWNLPGAWQHELPASITSLVGRDMAFLRGDFVKKRVPRSYPV